MPPKKRKQEPLNQLNMHVVLRDNKTSRHHVFPRDQLSFAKKDNLKSGTCASFNGAGDPSNRCRGIVIMSGTKQQCDNAVSLIEKTNNNNKEPVESESDSSHQLIIDDRTEKSEDDNNNNNERSADENEISACAPISQQSVDVISATGNSTNSSITTSANNSSSFLSPTTVSTCATVLTGINNGIDGFNKRKELPESTSVIKKKQRATSVSHSENEKLKRQINQLNREINNYKNNWMPRPSGPSATYFIEVGKILSGEALDSPDEDKGDKLEKIRVVLKMSEKELRSCEHESDITKTCRQIIKFIYRDAKERSKMLVSSMDANVLKCIQDYARMAHPAQSKISNSVLNNAIGNVFATEKRKQGDYDIENDSPNEMEEAIDDDENIEE